ncbi:DUF6245 family protein [Herbidospora cretacea]|uniref:DUF6245 family protein n=1 Tax=Herbidospora cretacea TaxID=28444 RepID=UPI003AFAB833
MHVLRHAPTGPIPLRAAHAPDGPQWLLEVVAAGQVSSVEQVKQHIAQIEAARECFVHAIGNVDVCSACSTACTRALWQPAGRACPLRTRGASRWRRGDGPAAGARRRALCTNAADDDTGQEGGTTPAAIRRTACVDQATRPVLSSGIFD